MNNTNHNTAAAAAAADRPASSAGNNSNKSNSNNCRNICVDVVTRWTDDQIRWNNYDNDDNDDAVAVDTENKTQIFDNDDNDNDDDIPYDPFKDPDPTETFVFEFTINPTLLIDASSSSSSNNNNKNPTTISIELSGYKAESDAIWQSTGLTLWKASQHLCHYIIQNSSKLLLLPQDGNRTTNKNNTKRILELGAGLGLVGILVHKLLLLTAAAYNNNNNHNTTNSQVCVTDGDSDVLVQLAKNIQRNCCCYPTYNNNDDATTTAAAAAATISCQQLLWGRETATQFLQQHQQNNNNNNGRFDLILASDIIYVECIIEPLWETIQTLLLSPNDDDGGIFLMAFAKRRVPVSIDFVLESATKAGFSYKQCNNDDEAAATAAQADNVLIYEFRWSKMNNNS